MPNHDASSIAVLDPESLQVTGTIAVSKNPHAVAFSPAVTSPTRPTTNRTPSP